MVKLYGLPIWRFLVPLQIFSASSFSYCSSYWAARRNSWTRGSNANRTVSISHPLCFSLWFSVSPSCRQFPLLLWCTFKDSTEVADGAPRPSFFQVQAGLLSNCPTPCSPLPRLRLARGPFTLGKGSNACGSASLFLFGISQPAGYTHFPLLQAISFKGSDTHAGAGSQLLCSCD